MCITAPARVLVVDGGFAAVELDGRRRLASLAVLPDVVPGDWVIVGAGTVLRRLDPADAQDVRHRIDAARSAAGLRGRSFPPAPQVPDGTAERSPEGDRR